jgi:hypothetical protein
MFFVQGMDPMQDIFIFLLKKIFKHKYLSLTQGRKIISKGFDLVFVAHQRVVRFDVRCYQSVDAAAFLKCLR